MIVPKKPKGKEYYISKKAGRAIIDYRMISDGDKILVAVSGGKDSLALLQVLRNRQSFVPISYSILAVHVDLGYKCIHPKILVDYFKNKGYDYHIEKRDVLKGKSRSEITCFWCSWNRRKALFEVAKQFGCNKIALGHHKDDIAQTTLLNLLFQGEISTMCPKQDLFKGEISIIRPLAYVEEQEIINFVEEQDYPVHRCSCPNSGKSNRAKVSQIINDIEKICPEVKTNICKSSSRIKTDYLL